MNARGRGVGDRRWYGFLKEGDQEFPIPLTFSFTWNANLWKVSSAPGPQGRLGQPIREPRRTISLGKTPWLPWQDVQFTRSGRELHSELKKNLFLKLYWGASVLNPSCEKATTLHVLFTSISCVYNSADAQKYICCSELLTHPEFGNSIMGQPLHCKFPLFFFLPYKQDCF